MKTTYIYISALAFLLLPTAVGAQGFFQGPLVQCGNTPTWEACTTANGASGKREIGACGTCDLVRLGQAVINYFVFLLVVVATLLFAYAGVLYMFSPPSPSNIQKAHGIFWNVLLGLVFVLAAWLIIDTVMKVFYAGSQSAAQWGPWNSILCSNQNPDTCIPDQVTP